jgi:TfoX/Sxy family transcriptional regulator of competence genes
MSAPKKNSIPPERLAVYDKLIAAHPDVERKGAANAYTSVNGNMYTLMVPSWAFAIRLPEKERAEFLKKHKAKLFEAYGAVMREYVAVPDSLFSKPKELQKYFALSVEYAKALRPKPTKKKS